MNHCHLFVCLELESCKLFHKCRWGQSSHRCCNINNWDDSVQDLVCALYLHFNVILQLSIQEVEGNGLLEFRILWKRWHLIYKYSTFTLLLTILPLKTCWVDELKCYNTSNVNTAVFHLHHYFLYVYSKRTPANSSENASIWYHVALFRRCISNSRRSSIRSGTKWGWTLLMPSLKNPIRLLDFMVI